MTPEEEAVAVLAARSDHEACYTIRYTDPAVEQALLRAIALVAEGKRGVFWIPISRGGAVGTYVGPDDDITVGGTQIDTVAFEVRTWAGVCWPVPYVARAPHPRRTPLPPTPWYRRRRARQLARDACALLAGVALALIAAGLGWI